MPRPLALRLDEPYLQERKEVERLRAKLLVDSSREADSRMVVIEHLNQVIEWLLADESRLAMKRLQRGGSGVTRKGRSVPRGEPSSSSK